MAIKKTLLGIYEYVKDSKKQHFIITDIDGYGGCLYRLFFNLDSRGHRFNEDGLKILILEYKAEKKYFSC